MSPSKRYYIANNNTATLCRRCFFVCSRHVLSLFIFHFFTFVYISIYLLLRKFDSKFELVRVRTYHKINPALSGLCDYLEN